MFFAKTYAFCGSISLATIALLLNQPTASAIELVNNGGGETTTRESGNLIPAEPGIFDGDAFDTVEANDGITPRNGNQMFQFLGVGPDRDNPGGCCTGDLVQILDLSAFSTDIAIGNTSVTAEAFFNATAPPMNSTYDFLFNLRAFDGDIPTTIPTIPPLATASETLSADNNLNTWESINFNLDLPAATTHLFLLVSATETDENGILQRPPGGFFQGSYGDDISVQLNLPDNNPSESVPEPSIILGLLAIGEYGLQQTRRRQNRTS